MLNLFLHYFCSYTLTAEAAAEKADRVTLQEEDDSKNFSEFGFQTKSRLVLPPLPYFSLCFS